MKISKKTSAVIIIMLNYFMNFYSKQLKRFHSFYTNISNISLRLSRALPKNVFRFHVIKCVKIRKFVADALFIPRLLDRHKRSFRLIRIFLYYFIQRFLMIELNRGHLSMQ